MITLIQKKLKKLLHYNPDTGIFAWKPRRISMFRGKNPQRMCNVWNTRYAGKEAGSQYQTKKSKTAYARITITLNEKKKLYRVHRLAFLCMKGKFPEDQVDHIDQNGLNNAWINLRDVVGQENKKNKPVYSNNTSGCPGVSWHEAAQKWHVRININGERISVGFFTNKEDAIQKRKELEIDNGYHANHGRTSNFCN